MQSFDKILTKLARQFKLQNVPYMIIGGQALLIHGEPRLTKDIDITLGVEINEKQGYLKTTKIIT